MVICFDCSIETKQYLDDLVAEGQYRDYSEAIRVAVANQILLHRKVGKDGSVVVRENTPRSGGEISMPKRRQSSQVVGVDYTNRKLIEAKIPDIFRIPSISSDHEFAPISNDAWSESTGVPVEQWVFGQYNKLFPAKASCRAIANILSSKRNNSDVIEIAQGIAAQAAELGRYLVHHDLQNSIQRDNRLSTAFPTPDPLSEKSRERFANQFVISVNRSGQLSSLLVDFKFLNHVRQKETRVVLTEPGWYFASLPNPVLDGEQQDPADRFTQREKDFLIEHIIRYVLAERFAYRTILNAVIKGENTPDKLDQALKAYVKDQESYTASFLSAQRSGAISRMADLDLLTRSRDGVRVTYEVTEHGLNFLERSK